MFLSGALCPHWIVTHVERETSVVKDSPVLGDMAVERRLTLYIL